MKKKVLINILNYNSQKHIKGCISSVMCQTYENIELLIMDNGSSEGSIKYIKENFPDIDIQLNGVNFGFAKAHNLAIESNDFDYYMPLNPDIILEPNFVTEMVSAIESFEVIGSANGKIFFLNSIGKKTEYLYSAGHEFDRARRSSNRGYKKKDSIKFMKENFVFGANGAAPLYKKEFLKAVKINEGYFDRDFFMYWEDTDIGWRGVLMGYKCLYVPSAISYHYGFGSEGLKNKYIQYQYERNRFISIYKNDLLSFFIADLPVFLFHEMFNLSFYLVTSPGRVIQYFRALIGFIRIIKNKKRERSEIMLKMKIDKASLREYYMNPWFGNLLRRRTGFKPESINICSSKEVSK